VLISLRWISDYVLLPELPLKEVVETLTLGTAEVEDTWLWNLQDGSRNDEALGTRSFSQLDNNTDFIIEIDNKSLTHRPDLWGHYGFAREFAALFRTSLQDTFSDSWHSESKAFFSEEPSPIQPSYDPGSACSGYCGLSVDSVVVESSPTWIQERLSAVGLRPVNTLVDIGNYVMLETGIPLHIFDREKIEGNITVRQIKNSEELVLLDGTTVQLEEGDSVVADVKGSLVLGGIMGGKSSAVSESTRKIFIESANWDAARVRRTSSRIGVRTDSSLRYEKSLDTTLLDKTVLRAAELVRNLNKSARIRGVLEYAPGGSYKSEPVEIELSHSQVERVLGVSVPHQQVLEILSALDFGIIQNDGKYSVRVPSFRSTKDVAYAEDLIEELGRIIGYNNIPAHPPLFPVEGYGLNSSHRLAREIQDFLVTDAKASEVMTYPLIGEDLLERALWPIRNNELILQNAWSSFYDRMRPSLVPSILEKVALNQKSYDDFQLFEIGRSYHFDQKTFRRESQELALCFFGRRENRYVELLEVIERFVPFATRYRCELREGLETDNHFFPQEWKGCHPFHSMTIAVEGKVIGAVTEVTPSVVRRYKMRGRVAIALLHVSLLLETTSTTVQPFRQIPQYPASTFDVTVIVPAEKPVGAVLEVDSSTLPKEIQRQKIRSIFPLSDKERAVTVRTVFLDTDATLSSERLKELEEWVVGDLARRGFPLKEV
jgi:phenylalanyl-tRNA synthetase beta chain